jgi:hypothetical protein
MDSRELLCRDLISLGVRVRGLKLDDPRETLSYSGLSLGVIEVRDEPISWINLRPAFGAVAYGDNEPNFADYAVPDERLRQYKVSSLSLEPVKRHNPLLLGIGGSTKVQWRGRDAGLGVRQSLQSAAFLNDLWLESGEPDVRILAHSEPFAFWRIALEFHFWLHRPLEEQIERRRREWLFLRTLAESLLRIELRLPSTANPGRRRA